MKANCSTPSLNTAEEPLFVQVAIPSPLRALFDYLPPDGCSQELIEKGTRVLIPFGRRQVTGIVVFNIQSQYCLS